MPYIDLHTKPFDNGTVAKLEIFEAYAEAWIPTFVMNGAPHIHVFDFFSGPGYDSLEVPGSPIRLLQKAKEYLGYFFQKKTKITLHLNEFEPTRKSQNKFNALKHNCEEFLEKNPRMRHFLSIEYYNKNSEILFFELLPKMREYPSLVYLDQNGVKFIAQQYISELEKLQTTDFLYFVSSSYFKRLGGTEEFKRVLTFGIDELSNEKQTNMHRLVATRLKKSLPINTELKLFPFSIKKGPNVYGIIFGAKHYRAVDKFLHIAWDRNKLNGEADFDIDNDISKISYDLFGRRGITKIEKFQSDLAKNIKARNLVNNRDVLLYTYQCGHIPGHAKEEVKRLREHFITYTGRTPAINYDNLFKKGNIVHYTSLL